MIEVDSFTVTMEDNELSLIMDIVRVIFSWINKQNCQI